MSREQLIVCSTLIESQGRAFSVHVKASLLPALLKAPRTTSQLQQRTLRWELQVNQLKGLHDKAAAQLRCVLRGYVLGRLLLTSNSETGYFAGCGVR